MPALLFLIALLSLCCALGCGGGVGSSAAAAKADNPAPGVAPARIVKQAPPFRFFGPKSPWNRVLSASTPLDPRSRPIVRRLVAEVAHERLLGEGPTINTLFYSVPIYTVPADQATVRVTLTAPDAPTLRSSWAAVPLPSDAHPAAGTDGHLVLWQPSTDRLWEFWRLVHDQRGWHASWGGSMQNVSSSSGVYGPKVWPGATRWWGASASSLSIAGGLITLEDLERGQINHALAIATPNIRAGVFALPAQRTDGTSASALSLPEGAHLRLDPKLNLATLRLPRVTRMIAEAAQRYGIFIRDGAPAVTSFFAQDPTALGIDPYREPGGYFHGREPSELAARFPWRHLQLVAMKLRSAPSTAGVGS